MRCDSSFSQVHPHNSSHPQPVCIIPRPIIYRCLIVYACAYYTCACERMEYCSPRPPFGTPGRFKPTLKVFTISPRCDHHPLTCRLKSCSMASPQPRRQPSRSTAYLCWQCMDWAISLRRNQNKKWPIRLLCNTHTHTRMYSTHMHIHIHTHIQTFVHSFFIVCLQL